MLPDAVARRNDTISRLGVLRRAGDPGLTALTRLSSYISGAEAAAIHILDDTTQHRVAGIGAPLGRHPREDSMCRLVVDAGGRIVCADATRDRLQDLADQVTSQIELTQVAVDLGHLASHDALTGAVNGLVLGDRLAQAFARRERHGGDTASHCGPCSSAPTR